MFSFRNTTANQYQEPSLIDNDNNESESEEIPDPFSDDELEELCELKEDFTAQMLASAAKTIHVDDKDECVDKDNEKTLGFLPIFVPSMSYLAQVPSSMQPKLLTSEKEPVELKTEPSRERVDENVLEEVDDNVRDLINRLSSSTSRGAFLANRLSDIHRRIEHGASLTNHNDWFGNDTDEQDTETDIEPNKTESDDELTVPSPELESEIADVVWTTGHFSSSDLPKTSTPFEEDDFDDSRPASTDSMILAIYEAIQILDPISMGQIPLAPPELLHVSGHSHHLHHHETCQCAFGKIGRKKKKEANEKRRAFYKTERGQTIKNRYKETAKLRNELIEKLMAHKSGTNLAEIEKETILKLLRKMQ